MKMHEAELPGVGRKFWIHTDAGEKVTIIRHSAGKREVYRFQKGEEFPSSVIELSEEEAREVGAVLSGEFRLRTVERMDVIVKEMSLEWVKVEPGSSADGRTIRELAIRTKTGISILAILREDLCVPGPESSEVLKGDDVLLVIGRPEHHKRFRKVLAGE
ncbi:MAG: cation:proton antiporter regulatory subunit [Nitrospirae bacterium]|nr:cation:proton antiporter regulatory subunit [Nitrospirota bacterium]MBI3391919.1 cation:proton antiporter regulatory subunit [Nitrospirota bacterium]